jgi:4-hydroxybenzoate polyprenyltransferase
MVAGASPVVATRLGVAMLALQCSIGSLNDLVDAEQDAGRKLRKPIPAGLVGVGEARLLVAGGLSLGLGLAAWSGPSTLAVALAGVGTGYLYDLRLKGTSLSWAPYAVGIPLLPVFAWLGTIGTIPGTYLVLVPLGALAGTALAIGNARADHERDLDAGVPSVATRLGLERSWALHAVLLLAVVAVAIVAGAGSPGARSWVAAATGGAGLVIAAGIALGRNASPWRRELAWEVEATGVGLLAVAWLLGIGANPG